MKIQAVKNQTIENQEAGQAVIEFSLSLMVILSFCFFFIKLAVVFAVSNYVQYATFMSARAYQSSSTTLEDQVFRAAEVLRKTVDGKWKGLIRGVDGDGSVAGVNGPTIGQGPYYEENPMVNFWNQGVTYTFITKLSFYPFSTQGTQMNLKLRSEAWQGREESIQECLEKKNKLNSVLGAGGSIRIYWENADHGC